MTMARMNPRRRLIAKQKALLLSIVNEHGPSHDDSSLLQQGNVKSGLTKFNNKVGSLHAPRSDTWEGLGQRKRTSTKRWGVL